MEMVTAGEAGLPREPESLALFDASARRDVQARQVAVEGGEISP